MNKNFVRILIVDDDIGNRKSFSDYILHGLDQEEEKLAKKRVRNPVSSVVKLQISTAKDGDDAYETIMQCYANEDCAFDILLVDLMMGGGSADGDALLKRLIRQDPSIPAKLDVFIVSQKVKETGESSPNDRLISAEALWKSNGGYIENLWLHSVIDEGDKEKFLNDIWARIYDLIIKEYNKESSDRERSHGMGPVNTEYSIEEYLIGNSIQMKELREKIKLYASVPLNILIYGETGTGKEVVAKCLHALSNRRDKKFVAIDIPNIHPDLVQSQFFGYKKGAFTGANTDKTGAFVEADGGTVFLDEIECLTMSDQARFLRVLQEKEVTPINENTPIPINVKWLVAAKEDLKERLESGKFREDLYYRLRVIEIKIPPLRERLDDVQLLFSHFYAKYAAQYAAETKRSAPEITQEALDRLKREQVWEGNVRELSNCAARYVFSDGLITETFLDVEERVYVGETMPFRMNHYFFYEAIINAANNKKDGSISSYADAKEYIINYVRNKHFLCWSDDFDNAKGKITDAYKNHVFKRGQASCNICKKLINENWRDAEL